MRFMERVGEAANRRETREIELHHFDRRARIRCDDLRGRRVGFVKAAAGENGGCLFSRELKCRLITDSTVAPGDDDGFSREIRLVLGGPWFGIGHHRSPGGVINVDVAYPTASVICERPIGYGRGPLL